MVRQRYGDEEGSKAIYGVTLFFVPAITLFVILMYLRDQGLMMREKLYN